jgi:hypothetical protein
MQWLTTDWFGPNNQAAENVCERTCADLCLGEMRTANPSAPLRVCDFIGFAKKSMLKTKNLGASKSTKNQ